MNQTLLNTIRHHYLRSQHRTSNKTLIAYCHTHGIGKVINHTTYELSQHDLEQLRRDYETQSGCPIHQVPNLTSRSNNPNQNEKSGAEGVFAANLAFAALDPSAILPHNSLSISINHLGFVPTIRAEHCNPAKIHRLIIVENGDLLNSITQWLPLLPEQWQTGLVLYRGHGNNNPHTQTLLKRLADHVPVAYYPDLDPQGIHIAEQYLPRINALIIPTDYLALTRDHRYNQRDKHAQQIQQNNRLPTHPKLAILYQHLLSEQLAIMQEKHHHIGTLTALAL